MVPMYTSNIEVAYSTLPTTRPLSLLLHACTRVAVAPLYGGLPTPLTTRLAPPVPSAPGGEEAANTRVVEELARLGAQGGRGAGHLGALLAWLEGQGGRHARYGSPCWCIIDWQQTRDHTGL